jgi:hypothetical protein
MISNALGIKYGNSFEDFTQDEKEEFIPHVYDLTFDYLNPNCDLKIYVRQPFSRCLICPKCGYEPNLKRVQNIIERKMKEMLSKHIFHPYRCDGQFCDFHTDCLPLTTNAPIHRNSIASGKNCDSKLIYTHSNIEFYETLRFFVSLFVKKPHLEESQYDVIRQNLLEIAEQMISLNGFNSINLSEIFCV